MKSGDYPADFGPSARKLWDEVDSAFDLDPHEREILIQACRLSDICTALAEVVAREGAIVKSRLGADIASPAAKELRQQALAQGQLLRLIRIPADGTP